MRFKLLLALLVVAAGIVATAAAAGFPGHGSQRDAGTSGPLPNLGM